MLCVSPAGKVRITNEDLVIGPPFLKLASCQGTWNPMIKDC